MILYGTLDIHVTYPKCKGLGLKCRGWCLQIITSETSVKYFSFKVLKDAGVGVPVCHKAIKIITCITLFPITGKDI